MPAKRGPIESKRKKSPYGKAQFWWDLKDSKRPDGIFATLDSLQRRQMYQIQDGYAHMGLYGSIDSSGLNPNLFPALDLPLARLKYNVCKSVVDAVTAKVIKDRIKCTFLTEGGNASIQRRAKMLDKFVLGMQYQTKFHREAERQFLEGCVFGTGIRKVYRKKSQIYIDRLFPWELWVDEREAIYGTPLTMYQDCTVERAVLMNAYPDFEEEIALAPAERETKKPYDQDSDRIRVVEAWRLPTKDIDELENLPEDEQSGGLHSINIKGIELVGEDYRRKRFPFLIHRYADRLNGFWGEGLVELLTGIQMEINKILRENQRIIHLADIPKVIQHEGSEIMDVDLDNEIGALVTIGGDKDPIFATMGSVSQQRFMYLDWLIRSAYEIGAISQLTAQAKKPEGLDSGKALREFHDIESDRFAMVERKWEDLHLEGAEMLIELAREIDSDPNEPPYEVTVSADRYAEKIKWKQINLRRDQYIMKAYPTNLLATEPAARMEDVRDLGNIGMYPPQVLRSLLSDFPDVAAANARLNAPYDLMQKIIEKILDQGILIRPEPYMDLAFGVQEMQNAYLQALIENVPDDRLELMRQWMDRAKLLISPPPQEVPDSVKAALAGADNGLPPSTPETAPVEGALPPGPPEQGLPPTIQ